MRVEFNSNSYTVGHKIGKFACTGCVISKNKRQLNCPINSKGECILPSDKIYINLCSNQVFKL